MGKRLSIIQVSSEKLDMSVLPRATKKAFLYLQTFDALRDSDWYLAGGTTLALQKGHRQSVDLDFFSERNKEPEIAILERALFRTGQWHTTLRQADTLYGKLLDAKVSFIAYPFFKTSPTRIACGNIQMLSSEDIAAMKIIAVSQRGRKRDFVDLYWYCRHCEHLSDIIRRAVQQYPGQEHNMGHILKSLSYFDDAEDDPMPKIFFKTNWRSIKLFFQKEAVRVTRELLGLK